MPNFEQTYYKADIDIPYPVNKLSHLSSSHSQHIFSLFFFFHFPVSCSIRKKNNHLKREKILVRNDELTMI